MNSEKFIFDRQAKEERDYWVEKLSHAAELPRLAPDVRSSVDAASATGVVEVEISGDLYAKLSRITGNSAFLLYTFLMASLKICLQRHTGSATVIVGSPALKELGRANALAIVDELDERKSFRELLLQVRETLLEAYARQRYPFERVLRDLKFEDAANARSLFDAALVLTDIHGELAATNNQLTLTFTKSPERLDGQIRFASDHFSPERIERFAQHLTSVLDEATDAPGVRLVDLSLLPEAEQQQVLKQWNDTGVEYPEAGFVHELFTQQAASAPENVAVELAGQRWSYAEINARANQLARYLSKLGVGRDVLVGLCVEPSPEMIVGILGTLKAGGAYLPLDPTAPRERTAYTLADAGIAVLLTQEKLRQELPRFDGASISLDGEWDEISRERDDDFAVEVAAGNLAYVIYTSGSTGQPKGVMISHGGLSNYLNWAAGAYSIAGGAGAPLHSTIAFDLSVTSIFGPLVLGRKVVLVAGAKDVESLADSLRQHDDFSLVKATPAHVRLLGEQLRSDEAPGRARVLVIGGEALTTEDILFWQRFAPHTRIVNEYGPTETVVGCCVYEVPASSSAQPAGSILIGRPIANTQLYVLDHALRPQPVGVPGELYIAGAGLARGYLNRPELTAEKFVPHPFSDEPGARLYRTGDLARRLPDGNIDFLGRIDTQVKIRGYRVELGEIEAVLAAHAGVSKSVVLLREHGAGERRLVAYFVGAGTNAPGADELRAYLRERLPEYMLPSAFVAVEEFPLTRNGKIDQSRLPAPEQADATPDEAFEAARTPVQEVVAGIWSQVLNLSRVSLHHNFFELGGHSLLITQVISRVREAFQVEMPMRTLFGSPTVAGMAEKIEEAMRAEKGLLAPSVERTTRDGELPLSFAQQRLWFLDQLMPGTSAFNIPEAMRLTGPLDVNAFTQALNELVRRHESLRTTFPTVEGRAFQVITPSLDLTLPVEDLRDLPESERRETASLRIREAAQSPFDLADGPLLRASLLRLADEEYIVLFNTHHIISDAWSIGVMVREVAALYQAYAAGKPSPLAELPIQYADFARWQRELLQGAVLDEHLAYWKRHLAGAPAVLELPTDFPRPEVQTVNGAREFITLPATLSGELKAICQREGVTLFMALLASFQTLLRCWSGKEDLVIGTDVANRNRYEVENLIGFFINQLVLRTDLSGNPSFRELLKRVREVTLGAYAYQDLPFDRLVESLHVERSLQHSPLVQVKLVFQNAPSASLELPQITISRIVNESVTSDYDLTLTMWEDGECIKGRFEYNSDLFSSSTINALRENLETLLYRVVAEPDARLDALATAVAEADRRRQSARADESQKDLARKFQVVRRKAVSMATASQN